MPKIAVWKYRITLDIEMDSGYMQHMVEKNRNDVEFANEPLATLEKYNENGMLSSIFARLSDITQTTGTELVHAGAAYEYEMEDEDPDGRVRFSNISMTVVRELDTTRVFADDLRENGTAFHELKKGLDHARDPR